MSLHAQAVSFPFVSTSYISLWLGSLPPCLQSPRELCWDSELAPAQAGMAQPGLGGTGPSRRQSQQLATAAMVGVV